KAGNAFVTPMVVQVSIGSGDCLPSGDPSARLPANFIKKPTDGSEVHCPVTHAFLLNGGKVIQ
ncbi:hypothetical protein, partial [Akkermansia muciniphila]|uniref:hypothetical protein n=1 Tax=Akkermansia muciniphila TaxID=239935 RepID=UPI001C527562